MTHREATAIALKELGKTEETIQVSLEFADKAAGIGNTYQQLEPGTERAYIDDFKEKYYAFHLMTAEQQAALMKKTHEKQLRDYQEN